MRGVGHNTIFQRDWHDTSPSLGCRSDSEMARPVESHAANDRAATFLKV
jgi:hypothetical protein